MFSFKKKTPELTPVCKVCDMEFASIERMTRHMIKAHSKPCNDNSCGCR